MKELKKFEEFDFKNLNPFKKSKEIPKKEIPWYETPEGKESIIKELDKKKKIYKDEIKEKYGYLLDDSPFEISYGIPSDDESKSSIFVVHENDRADENGVGPNKYKYNSFYIIENYYDSNDTCEIVIHRPNHYNNVRFFLENTNKAFKWIAKHGIDGKITNKIQTYNLYLKSKGYNF